MLSLALFAVFVACEESDGDDDSDVTADGRRVNYVVKTVSGETCLPRPLAPEDAGSVPCQLIEAMPPSATTCSCDASTGRSEVVPAGLRDAVEDELTAKGLCGLDTGIKCSSHCLCVIQQLSGAELDTCLNSLTDPGGIYGYCYVAPNAGFGNPELVATCPETQPQIIRFLGENVPSAGASAFIACTGATVDAGAP